MRKLFTAFAFFLFSFVPVLAASVLLTWNQSTDNVGVAGYHIYRNGVLVGTSTTTTFTDTGLASTTQYTYTVSAFDAAGNESAQSIPVNVTTLASSGGDKTFVPLHTYFMSPTGSDAANGMTPATAWKTPNHSIVCGDVILAQAGSYPTLHSGAWGTVSNCPSTTGGIDGTGGVYFATVLCAGASVGACSVVGTNNGEGGIEVTANNWAVEGFAVSVGYTVGGPSGFGFAVDVSGGQIHHTAMINNIAYHNAAGYTLNNHGSNNFKGNDYWAIVGNIAQDSAGRCDGFYDSAIDVLAPQNWDTVAGTHIFVAGNFVYNNQQPGCNMGGRSDGESVMFDTLDILAYSQKIVMKNNILAVSERFGLQMFDQNFTQSALTLKVYNNTLYSGNHGASDNNPSTNGDINIQSTTNTISWIVSIFNNIALETVGSRPDGAHNYAFQTGPYGASVGGVGIENIFKGLSPSCDSTCDSGNNVIAYGSASNFGTNIYTDPLFHNAADFLANRLGTPNCSGFINTAACMGWNHGSQTATSPSMIYDLTATAAQAAGKGYQPPHSCAADADYPAWLKGIVYLQASGWVTGATITEKDGLITKPCGL